MTFLENVPLGFGLHTFRDDIESKAFAQIDHRIHDRGVFRIGIDVADEGPINLQTAHGIALE